MNYYEHHLGDYMRDTAHLSMLEDCAYRRLLDAYYTRERPLPLDPRECCKLARAASKRERDAVAYVLRTFFQAAADGHRQRRADAEIARYVAKSQKARAAVNLRWQRARDDRGAGDAGADTDADADADATPALPAHYERITNDIHHAHVPSPQSPITSHHTPESAPAGASRAGALCRKLKAAGIASVNPGHPRLAALLEAGASDEEFIGFVPRALEAGNSQYAYLLGAVEGERKRAAATRAKLHQGPLRAANRQEAVEAENRRVAAAWLAQPPGAGA